ncbi:MAG: hypothetical protein H6Q67_1633 [Firmicutes bacterium]|nr:hypothetical protein [Bacillota bacterium]
MLKKVLCLAIKDGERKKNEIPIITSSRKHHAFVQSIVYAIEQFGMSHKAAT